MIIGAHTVISTSNPNADRAFFRDVPKLRGVDAGGGFMIFGLPPAEVSLHEPGEHGAHELFLLCDDVQSFLGEMRKRNVACADVKDEGWGMVTQITLRSGGKVSVYQPRHARPSDARAKAGKGERRAKPKPLR
jgi:catechol 2,3-dioxygenase-like lactoylglutathione lyase family enzyme